MLVLAVVQKLRVLFLHLVVLELLLELQLLLMLVHLELVV